MASIPRSTTLPDVLLVTPTFILHDHRGSNVETWRADIFTFPKFVQDSVSISTRGVLRGIHGDAKTRKLVSCLLGKIYLVVVDPRTLKWEAFTLTPGGDQVLIPPGFGNGHQVESDVAVFGYKLSEYTDTESQFTIAWNDPRLGIPWPVADPILSKRDGGE